MATPNDLASEMSWARFRDEQLYFYELFEPIRAALYTTFEKRES